MLRSFSLLIGNLAFSFGRFLHTMFGFGGTCRFSPTCSQFAREAFSRFGVFYGGWLTFRRICRCRPGSSHGWDPVPEVLP